MSTNQPPILHFEIIGLHGDKNVYIDFDNEIKIIVNENGVGKTTVLNTLFNFLSGNWYKIAQVEFSTIAATFSNGSKCSIEQSELVADNAQLSNSAVLEHVRSRISSTAFDRLITNLRSYPSSVFRRQCEEIGNNTGIPGELIYDAILSTRRSTSTSEQSLFGKLSDKNAEIKVAFPYSLLYFPTYRRVEEDLQSLGYVEKTLNQDDTLIHFGMQDVKKRFASITSEIRDSSVEWYSIINGRILTQLIDGIQQDTIAYDTIEDSDVLRIILDRIGENISDKSKERILKMIVNGQMKDTSNVTLAYFLSNLTQVYEQQRSNDNAIKNFARVCNGYLSDKEVRYNESKVDIQIINKRSGKEVALDRLSSGEKQVISIFSRLYLEKGTSYAIFFDEPELSLSMEWQKKLLHDVVDSSMCAFLLAATHSPFIFENELDKFASELKIEFVE